MFTGYIAVSDSLRPDSAWTVSELHRKGIKTVMLTGDNEPAARAVAEELGIADYRASLLPQDKVAALDDLTRSGTGALAFLGDGINDAPILAIADIGVAMG